MKHPVSRAFGLLAALLLLITLTSACGGGGDDGGGGGGGNDGVCGNIGSVPKLCNLRVSPNPASRFGTVRVSFGVSDREGDIDKLCVGVAARGSAPDIVCDFISTRGSTINERITTDPINLGSSPSGTYAFALNVGDRAGNLSNTVTTTFEIR